MARTDIPVQTLPLYGAELDISWTAADATNEHSFANNGKCILIARNKHSGAQTVDVVSVAGGNRTFGETVTQQLTLAAGDSDPKITLAGPFQPAAFNQTDGVVHVNIADDTALQVAVVEYKNFT